MSSIIYHDALYAAEKVASYTVHMPRGGGWGRRLAAVRVCVRVHVHVHARALDVLVRSMLQQPFGSLPQVVDDVFSVDHKLFLQHCRGKSHQIKGREQDVDNGDTYGISFRKLQDVYGDYIDRSCNGKLCGLCCFVFVWLMSSTCLSTRQHKWQSYRPREVVQ